MVFEDLSYFWSPGSPKGVLSNHPRPSVCPTVVPLSVVRPSLDILATVHWFFHILTPGLSEGVLSNRPCLCVRVCVRPSLNISETVH